MKEKFSLKDHLFNKESVTYLAGLFSVADKNFNAKDFIQEVLEKFPELELKDRIRFMAEVLGRYLPPEPVKAMALIRKALPPELDVTKTDDDFGQFILAPLGEYVVQRACTKQTVEQALDTLYEITKRFSMEDAMRSFLNAFPIETLARLEGWVRDENYHVRRLVSESTRPMLPWSVRLTIPYQTMVPFLDILYADTARYVTRSVTNHLNDIAKKDAALVIETLVRWKREGRQNPDELVWMIRHALRTLIKQGNQDALTLLGYEQVAGVQVSELGLATGASVIARGEHITFSFVLVAEKDTEVLIDYGIDFIKSNGTTKTKIFKLKKLTLIAGQSIQVTKKHHFKADATTFTLYPGEHTITIQINGQPYEKISFTLT